MNEDDDITELTELLAEKVSGVSSPANGASWLVLKSAADMPHAPRSAAGCECAFCVAQLGPTEEQN